MDNSNNVMANGTDTDMPRQTFTGALPEWSKMTLSVLLVIVFTLGVPGNIMVVTTMLKLKLKTSTDWLIMFISMSDLLSLVISCPIYLMLFNSRIWLEVGSSGLCSFHYYVLHAVFLSSNLFIMAIGIDRFLKTCRPHSQTFSPKLAAIICCSITVISLVAGLPFAMGSYNNQSQCVYGNDITRRVTYIFLLLIVIVVSVVLTYVYARICMVIKRRVRTRPGARDNIAMTGGSVILVKFDKRLDTVQLHRVMERRRFKLQTASNVTCVSGVSVNNPQIAIENDTEQIQPNPELPSTSTNQPNGNASHVTSTQECSLYGTSGTKMAQKVEKTTRLVAIITGIFALCTIIPVISVVFLISSHSSEGLGGKIAVFFLLRVYLINNATNPIFFWMLSSKFRQKAKETFKCY